MKSRLFSATIAIVFLVGLASAQTNSDGSAPQFLFREFSPAKVIMKNGSRSGAMMNYNMVTEKMVYSKNEQLYDMINTELVDTIYLNNSVFVPVGRIFHEVLAAGLLSFYVQHKANLMSAGAPAGYGGTSQVSNSKTLNSVELSGGYYNLELPKDFTVSNASVYWIRKDKEYESFVTERQFLKLFPEYEDNLKQFIKKNRVKFDKPASIAVLGAYCNELIK